MCTMCLFFFFFFSSRRRHTRLVSDWSSDVCSSDLLAADAGAEDNPSAGNIVNGGDLFRRQRRRAQRQKKHGRAQTDAASTRGHRRERSKRIVSREVEEDMLARPGGLVSQLLDARDVLPLVGPEVDAILKGHDAPKINTRPYPSEPLSSRSVPGRTEAPHDPVAQETIAAIDKDSHGGAGQRPAKHGKRAGHSHGRDDPRLVCHGRIVRTWGQELGRAI